MILIMISRLYYPIPRHRVKSIADEEGLVIAQPMHKMLYNINYRTIRVSDRHLKIAGHLD